MAEVSTEVSILGQNRPKPDKAGRDAKSSFSTEN